MCNVQLNFFWTCIFFWGNWQGMLFSNKSCCLSTQVTVKATQVGPHVLLSWRSNRATSNYKLIKVCSHHTDILSPVADLRGDKAFNSWCLLGAYIFSGREIKKISLSKAQIQVFFSRRGPIGRSSRCRLEGAAGADFHVLQCEIYAQNWCLTMEKRHICGTLNTKNYSMLGPW